MYEKTDGGGKSRRHQCWKRAPHGTSVTTRFGGCRFYTEMALVHEAQWAGIAKKDADVNQSPPAQAANVKWQVDWLDRRLQECCKTYEGKKPRHKQSEQGKQNVYVLLEHEFGRLLCKSHKLVMQLHPENRTLWIRHLIILACLRYCKVAHPNDQAWMLAHWLA